MPLFLKLILGQNDNKTIKDNSTKLYIDKLTGSNLKPIRTGLCQLSNVLFLDQPERIEIGYFTYNLTGRKTNINNNKLLNKRGFSSISETVNMTPHAKEVKLNSEKKSCKS